LRELRGRFEGIKDKWFESYVEYLLSDIVIISLLAVMARANEWNDTPEFVRFKERRLRGFRVLSQGIPSHDPIRWRRLEREPAFAGEEKAVKRVAIDGKTGSVRNMWRTW
jgi:hypothetical protein